MEVSYKHAAKRFSYSDTPAAPAEQFALEIVTHTHPLRPYVDCHLPLSTFKKSRSTNALPSITTKGGTKGGNGGGGSSSDNSSRKQRPPKHAPLPPTKPIAHVLVIPFKPPLNLSPSQTRSPIISQALKDYQANNHDATIKKLTQAITNTVSTDPRSLYISHFVRGLSYAALDDYQMSVTDFKKCTKIDNRCPLSYFNRGVAYTRLNDRGAAIEDFTKAIKRDKSCGDFYGNRALLYRQAGDFQSAQKDYAMVRVQARKAEGNGGEPGVVDTREGTVMIEEEVEEENRREFERVEREKRENAMQGGENFFRPIEGEGAAGLSLRYQVQKKPTMKVGLPPISGTNNASNNEGSPSPNDRKSKRITRRTMRSTKSGKIVDTDEKKPISQVQAEAALKQRALKEKIHGLVHVALIEQPESRTSAQLDLLVGESKLMPAFKHLDLLQLRVLWKYLSYRRHVADRRLFEQGDDAKNFYVIWSGQVSARIPATVSPTVGSKGGKMMGGINIKPQETIVHTMNAGDTLGEAVGGGHRKAACVTEETTELLILNEHGFNKTFKLFFEKRDGEKTRFLRNFSIFHRRYWSDDELYKIASYCRQVEYKAGDTIVAQEQPCDAVYFIVSGLVSVCRAVTEGGMEEGEVSLCDVAVTKLCSGELFGESCILPDSLGVFQSSIVCETKVKCYRLDKAQLDMSRFQSDVMLAELKKISVIYPDDCVLLQMFLDQKRSLALKEKTMKELNKTLKKRDRKEGKKLRKIRY